MKINQCTFFTPFPSVLYKKNGKQKAETLQNKAEERALYAFELFSKFNISFGCFFDEKKLNNFCLNLENRIREMTEPKDAAIAQNALTTEYINIINNVFKEDNIGKTAKTGISANTMLNYLAAKKQLELKGNNTAFIIDCFSLDFLKKHKRLLYSIKMFYPIKNYKFYCLDTNKKETEKLIREFNNITGGKFKVKIITKPQNSKPVNYPNAHSIKTIIKEFAQYKLKEHPENVNKFIDLICRYINGHFLAFSYASLEERLKEQYKNIEKYVQSQGKKMQDVIYALPKENKSYDIINYLYAKVNNIPGDKFKYFKEIQQTPEKDKIYAVLDDICAGGSSTCIFLSNITNIKNIIIAPVVLCKTGEEQVKQKLKRLNPINSAVISCLKYNDLGWAANLIYNNHPAQEKYIKDNYNFLADDALFLINNLRGGCSNCCLFVCFPYMIPDNSSELNAFLGEYFLNKNSDTANKIVEYDKDLYNLTNKVPEFEYIDIKKRIKNSLGISL